MKAETEPDEPEVPEEIDLVEEETFEAQDETGKASEPDFPEEIDEAKEAQVKRQEEYQAQLLRLREQQEQQGQYIAAPETDLEFEAKLVEPGLNVQDIFDPKKFPDIRRSLINYINLNLATSNYDDKTLREMRLMSMAAIKTLIAMNVSGLDLSPAYNEIALNIQADSSMFKAHNGWANLMYRSQFTESKVLETSLSPAETELHQKSKFNLPVFTKARSGAQIVQSPSKSGLKTI